MRAEVVSLILTWWRATGGAREAPTDHPACSPGGDRAGGPDARPAHAHRPPPDGSAGALVLVAVAAPQAQAQTTAALINEQRAAHGLACNNYNAQLSAARSAIRETCATPSRATPGPTARRSGSGSPWRLPRRVKFGEIIGYAVGAPGSVWTDRDMVNCVMSSPGHRAHVLDPAYTEFGSTMAFRTVNGIQHKYWTVVFGRR